MIEINLIPDVKLELLKARRQRSMVISGSILLSIVAAGIVTVLAVYAFGVQAVADNFAQTGIDEQSEKLLKVKDLSKTLTIQNQLKELASSEKNKNVTSRLFDITSVTKPEGKNSVIIKRLALDSEEKTIEIEAEASNGYEAVEVFKKTIAETKLQYSKKGKAQKALKIATSIADGERRYSEDSKGKQVLRFTLSFTYPDELFSTESQDGKIVGPDKQTVTDSTQGVPTSLFESGSN